MMSGIWRPIEHMLKYERFVMHTTLTGTFLERFIYKGAAAGVLKCYALRIRKGRRRAAELGRYAA